MAGHRGFTLLELLVIIVILAILITMALPNLLGGRISANETAALATVRTLVQAQLAFQARKEADLNSNGLGEFGTFGEMSGNVAVRAASGGARRLDPNVVNPSFRMISPLGELLRGGYYFRIYLPNAAGEGLLELPGGGADAGVDPQNGEASWCVYAWPQKYGVSGRRCFFTNQAGDILFTEVPNYEGPGAAILPGAAFEPGGPPNDIMGIPAANRTGRDGHEWRAAGRN